MIVECQECGSKAAAQEAGSFECMSSGDEPSRLFTLLACLNCGSPLLVKRMRAAHSVSGMWDQPRLLFPRGEVATRATAPVDYRQILEEAHAHYRATEYTNAVSLCREAITAMAEANQVTKRSWGATFRALRERDLIDDRLLEWWAVLPITGAADTNAMHLPFSKQDAKQVLEFTGAVLEHLCTDRHICGSFERQPVAKATAAS